MRECDHCREALLDYVYGLLDEGEASALRAHVDACPSCQAALEAVRGQQKLLAQAAKAVRNVPEFALPSDTTTAPPVPGSSPATAPARRRWSRTWILSCSAAAAVLLTVGTLSYLHYQALHDLNSDLVVKRGQRKQLDDQLAALPAKYAGLQKDAVASARAAGTPYLHVVGPSQLEAGAKANVHVTLRDANGAPTRGRLHVQLRDEAARAVTESRVDCKDQTRIELDAAGAAPNTKLTLVIDAQTDTGKASLTENVHVAAPTYVTRLDTSKVLYQVNEVLFFRALVLDRWSLKPPAEPVNLHVKLINPKNETVIQFKKATEAGGMLAGELPVAANFHTGSYRLEITPADSVANVQPASRQVNIVREVPVPDIELNQQSYARGGTVSGGVFVPGGVPTPKSASATIGGRPVPVTIDPQPMAFTAPLPTTPGPGVVGFGPEKKKAAYKATDMAPPAALLQRFQFSAPVPKDLPASASQVPLKLELDSGRDRKAYNAVVPLEPAELAIDLFPEGGDLIAGVPNHVFFRVRARTGEPVTGDGRVILLSSKNEIVDAPYQLGLGSLEFTPELKETYTIRITSPQKTSEVVQPLAKLGLRTSGVVLHVPRAVGKQGEPIELTLRNQGPPRKLLLVAQCRGQIVDQRWVDAKERESIDTRLDTTSQGRGMIRVTAYEANGDALQPVAERLVYRTEVEGLRLNVDWSAQQFHPGQTTRGRIHASDESGKPAAGWLLASVVDERFQPKPRSLSAHFLLFNPMRGGADLEDADLILNDTPESVQMLERFLGTHGWRRFVHAETTGVQRTAAPAIFSRENRPLATIQQQVEDRVQAALTPLRLAAFNEQAKLEAAQREAARAVQIATAERHRLESRPEPIRFAAGLAFVGLLAVSLVLLAIGLYRIVRAQRSPTPAFGGAFACLAVCMTIYFVGNAVGPIPGTSQPEFTRTGDAPRPARLEERLAEATVVRRGTPTPPVGSLSMPVPTLEPRSLHETAKADGDAKKDAQLAQNAEAKRNLVTHLRAESAGFGGFAGRRADNVAMRLRFSEAQTGMNRGASPPAAPKGKTGAINPANAGADGKAAEREYAPKLAPGMIADTLLWNPSLYLADGNGEIRFDIPAGQATYRVLLLGHSSTGRLGFFETRIDVPDGGR